MAVLRLACVGIAASKVDIWVGGRQDPFRMPAMNIDRLDCPLLPDICRHLVVSM